MSPPVTPMLGNLELSLVQQIRSLEEQALHKLEVPGLNGGVFQNMGRWPTFFLLTGILAGDGVVEALEALRNPFQAREPLSFVADITTETQVTQVMIEVLRVKELAGNPQQFAYYLVLREYIPPPSPEPVLDGGLQDEAGGLFDDLTDNLDAISDLDALLGGAFDIADPTPPLRQLLTGFEEAMSGLESGLGALSGKLA